jgi:eukaryotic-like serine/threonine-protein kinase
MAEAYLALSGELAGLRTVVVVKRILPHLSANDQFVRMFLDEARIGALLDHPNIPRIIEVGHDEDGYFLVMEAVPGKTLSAILRRAARRERPLGHADAAFIIARAAAALGYAHALTDVDGRPLNIVHRDVSPENILISFEGAVKVIDFGIASVHGRMSETLVGGLKGKVEYMSPEQAAGAPVDRRSDVFSLGIILWEALSGRRLFRRDTDLAVMRAISDEPIPRPSGPRPIAPRLERIVMTALERAPEDRFADAREMAVLLERHAFRTDSFDPVQLVTQIKQLFPADHAGWKATMGTAQAVGTSGPRKTTAAFPMLGDASSRTGGPTQVLREKPRSEAPRREAPTHAEIARMFPAESPSGGPEVDDGPPLPRLTGWGGAQPELGSDGGERSAAETGDDAAAYHALRTWASRRSRLPAPVWLLVGAMVVAGVFVGLRWKAALPVTPPSIVDVRDQPAAVESLPVVEPLRSAADSPSAAAGPASTQAEPVSEPPAPAALAPIGRPALTPTSAPPAAPSAAARPAVRKSPPVPERAVKKPVRKQPIAHRAPAAPAKPAPARPSTARPEPRPGQSPPGRPGWRDPFQ